MGFGCAFCLVVLVAWYMAVFDGAKVGSLASQPAQFGKLEEELLR
jgi:hypothetical protein